MSGINTSDQPRRSKRLSTKRTKAELETDKPTLIDFGAGEAERSNLPLPRKPKSQNKGCGRRERKNRRTKRKASSDEPSPVSKNFARAKGTNDSLASSLLTLNSKMTTKSFIKDKQVMHTVPQWMYKPHSSSSRETWTAFTPEASKYIEQVWVCFQQNHVTCKRVVENGNHHFKVNVKKMTYEKQNTKEKGEVERKVETMGFKTSASYDITEVSPKSVIPSSSLQVSQQTSNFSSNPPNIFNFKNTFGASPSLPKGQDNGRTHGSNVFLKPRPKSDEHDDIKAFKL